MTGRRLVAAAAGLVVAGLCLLLLLPVLTAPVGADDRYWYLQAVGKTDNSVAGVLQYTWEQLPRESRSGRLAPLASLSRRLSQLAVMQLSVATAIPVVAWQAVLKLGLGVAALATCLAFVRSLRWRSRDGALVRAGGRTLALVGLGTALLAAAGSQAHEQFRNGWTSYAVLTWGAVVVVLGTTAVVMWLTRLVAERPRPATAPAVVVLLLLAAGLNLSYELNYVAVPVATLALLAFPVTAAGARRAGRRAKAVTAVSFLGGFVAVFAAVRVYLADVCSGQDCYSGVQPELGLATVRTALYNAVTALPVPGALEPVRDTDVDAGAGSMLRGLLAPVTGWSLLLGLLAALSLGVAWWALARPPRARTTPTGGAASAGARGAEARLLLAAAVLAAAAGLGEALLMGLSVQAQELIATAGLPYRNTMITWTTLALAAVLVVRALTLLGRPRLGVVAVAVLAAAVGAVVATTLPYNLAALRDSRADAGAQAVQALHWEVVLGDAAEAAEQRRCDVLRRVSGTVSPERVVTALTQNAQEAYQALHGRPFCADPPKPAG